MNLLPDTGQSSTRHAYTPCVEKNMAQVCGGGGEELWKKKTQSGKSCLKKTKNQVVPTLQRYACHVKGQLFFLLLLVRVVVKLCGVKLSIHPQFRTESRDLCAAHLVGERHSTRLMSPAKRLDNELCTRYSFLYVYISALLLLLFFFFVLFCFVFSPATLSTKRGYKKNGAKDLPQLSPQSFPFLPPDDYTTHTASLHIHTQTQESSSSSSFYVHVCVCNCCDSPKTFSFPPSLLFLYFFII